MIFRSCQRVHDSSPTLVPWMMAPSVSLTSWCSTSAGEREVWTIQTHNHGGAGECLPTCVYKMHGVCICICTHTSFCCLYYRCVHIYIYNYIYRRFAFQTIWIIYYLHLFTKATWTVTICLDIICIIVRYTLDDDVNFPEQRVHKFSTCNSFSHSLLWDNICLAIPASQPSPLPTLFIAKTAHIYLLQQKGRCCRHLFPLHIHLLTQRHQDCVSRQWCRGRMIPLINEPHSRQ